MKIQPFKLTFKDVLNKSFRMWKQKKLQVQHGSGHSLANHHGRCAIGCALPDNIIRAAKRHWVATPSDMIKKKLIIVPKNNLSLLNKIMDAHDKGIVTMRNFFIKHGKLYATKRKAKK